MTKTLLWIDEDADRFFDVHVMLSSVACHVEYRYSMHDGLRALTSLDPEDPPIILLDLICPLGPVDEIVRGWARSKLVDACGGWYGASVLHRHPCLAANTIVLSILPPFRVERGLSCLELSQPAAAFSKLSLHKSMKHLRNSIMALMAGSRSPLVENAR